MKLDKEIIVEINDVKYCINSIHTVNNPSDHYNFPKFVFYDNVKELCMHSELFSLLKEKNNIEEIIEEFLKTNLI